ncbi:unnamed protein product [Hermetia illucens]|uniref:Uncharacterized protein n=1 Tax=Hermetia illucens TaxID=343691 RepID=A0A7R8V3I4_HERIL|nr:uncharacterized protein LOC119658991 [Hermetia illucens]CAD7092186.1 unnamed protein product [Hermetia illucens]
MKEESQPLKNKKEGRVVVHPLLTEYGKLHTRQRNLFTTTHGQEEICGGGEMDRLQGAKNIFKQSTCVLKEQLKEADITNEVTNSNAFFILGGVQGVGFITNFKGFKTDLVIHLS